MRALGARLDARLRELKGAAPPPMLRVSGRARRAAAVVRAAEAVGGGPAVTGVAAAIAICFVATIYPSRQAARLDPAQALRYQ